jgi:hypothetical protein
MPKYTRNLETVREHFDRDALTEICQMHELDFGKAFDLDEYEVPAQKAPDNYYYFRDNGASVLAVAHLDTVVYHDQRTTRFYETNDGLVVHSGALDDRLGAYTILDLLPKCGIEYDILLTVGEESGQSTAMYFDADKDYDWIIEFDRGGTDVVMYQYDDEATRAAVRRTGARVGDGIFSDISYMEHVGVKGFNWGVGYQDYHSTRGHAYIDDYLSMIARYLKFHQQNAGTAMPHDETKVPDSWWGGFGKGRNDDPWWNEDDEFLKHNAHDHTDEEIDNYQRAGLWDMSDHRTGFHGHGFDPVDDDPYYSEGVYTDDEYIEDPTIEEIQAALERMDDEDAKWAAIMEGRAS